MAIDCVLMASGGLDSTTLAYQLVSDGRSPLPLFIDYGQHCADTEWKTLHRVLPSPLIDLAVRVDISDVYAGTGSRLIAPADLWHETMADDDLFLPYRNLLTLSVAAAYAQSRGLRDVFAAFINTARAHELDCSAEFFHRLEDVFADYGAVTIRTPFRDLTKAQVAQLARQHGVPIGLTYSCQVGAEVPCGACPNCVERLAALRELREEKMV